MKDIQNLIAGNDSCVTIRELKEWLKNVPDTDECGEDREVWVETGKGLSSPVLFVGSLNLRWDGSFDIIFESGVDWDKNINQ